MSLDPSLKSASSLVRHRNVLSRGERLLRLADAGKWDDSKAVLGIPKVGNRKAALAKSKGPAAEGDAAAAAPAAGGKAAAAPAAKAAAPAAAAAGAKKK